MVRQVEGLDRVVKGGGTIVGRTWSVGQGAGVDSQDWAVLVADVCCEFGILGVLATSACLPATVMVVAALSLGRSVSAATAVGPALLRLGSLLLLLGELQVCLLVLDSTQFVGLRGLSTTAV